MRRIFCVEGAWSENLADTESVLPLLHLLQGVGKIESIHRYVETREGLLKLLARWTQKKYAKWSIAYVAFHGSPGRLHLHDEELKLEELADALRGKCRDRILYFGSCQVLRISEDDIKQFRKATGARAVAGYTSNVDWFESSAMNLLLLRTWWSRSTGICQRSSAFASSRRSRRQAPQCQRWRPGAVTSRRALSERAGGRGAVSGGLVGNARWDQSPHTARPY